MRIRSIKPEFWSSDDIAALCWEDRLLFIGLWSYVADSGVGRDNPKLITADLFPLEDDPLETLATVSRGLASLSAAGLITRYSVAGKRYLHINAWTDHQKIDRPTRSPFPPPTCDDAVIEESSRANREPSPPGSRDLGNEGAGEQGSEGSPAIAADTDPLDRFDEFWDTYAKKVDRKKAEAKWRLALKRKDVTPDRLIEAARQYVTWERANNEGGRYVMDPARWLNGHRWEDERPARPEPMSNVQQHLALAQRLHEREQGATIREIGPRR